MPNTIFFSWQADAPTKEGRNLMERALERAVSRIGDDTAIEEAVRDLRIDRDTKGIPGSPPIVETIFRKIDNAAVFVPDLTFVGKRIDGRPTPNPNVLIEYGWALKSLGYERIVPVMNTAFGKPTPEAMPFDMRHLRNPILYECPIGANDELRKLARESLAKELELRLRDVLTSDGFKDSLPKPPQPPLFPAHASEDGPGRFRKRDEPLGVSHGSFFGRSAYGVKLSDEPVVWFRVMPTADPGRTWLVTELEKAAIQGFFLQPVSHGWTNYHFVRNHDGFGVYAPIGDKPGVTCAAVFAFTTGEIWSVDSYLLEAMARDGRNAVPDVEEFFRRSLQEYAGFLTKLGIDPPFRWMAGMENLKGRGIFVPAPPGRTPVFPGPRGQCVLDVVSGDGLYCPGDPPSKSLRPYFIKLFDSCGIERPQWLDD